MLILMKLFAKYVIIYALGSRYIKSSASESKPFQSRSKGEIPGRARRKERLSRSKLKHAFLVDSDAELFMHFNVLGSAHEKFLVWTGPKL